MSLETANIGMDFHSGKKSLRVPMGTREFCAVNVKIATNLFSNKSKGIIFKINHTTVHKL